MASSTVAAPARSGRPVRVAHTNAAAPNTSSGPICPACSAMYTGTNVNVTAHGPHAGPP